MDAATFERLLHHELGGLMEGEQESDQRLRRGNESGSGSLSDASGSNDSNSVIRELKAQVQRMSDVLENL